MVLETSHVYGQPIWPTLFGWLGGSGDPKSQYSLWVFSVGKCQIWCLQVKWDPSNHGSQTHAFAGCSLANFWSVGWPTAILSIVFVGYRFMSYNIYICIYLVPHVWSMSPTIHTTNSCLSNALHLATWEFHGSNSARRCRMPLGPKLCHRPGALPAKGEKEWHKCVA